MVFVNPNFYYLKSTMTLNPFKSFAYFFLYSTKTLSSVFRGEYEMVSNEYLSMTI